MDYTLAIALLIGMIALFGTVEAALHARNLRRIPIRIHVNGTRGKSSVTRLIAAGLRAGGIVTCAKTTGTEARFIRPDGTEYPLYRPSAPNIIEQVRIVNTAAALSAQALVVECMALQPPLQALSELSLIRSTHGVITNARADHLDVMGPRENEVAQALAGTVPVRASLFTAESRHLDAFRAAGRERGTELTVVSEEDEGTPTDEEMTRFSYLEHKSNVALALRVCEALGVERKRAIEGMWAAAPDPGVLTLHEMEFFGRRLFFCNGFAANDPESTEHIWRIAIEQVPEAVRRIAIFNCRVDRPERSWALGEACVRWPRADHYLLMGTGTYIFARAATRNGLDPSALVIREEDRPDEIFEQILEVAGPCALIMGMGNSHGGGQELARLFRNRGQQRHLR